MFAGVGHWGRHFKVYLVLFFVFFISAGFTPVQRRQKALHATQVYALLSLEKVGNYCKTLNTCAITSVGVFLRTGLIFPFKNVIKILCLFESKSML